MLEKLMKTQKNPEDYTGEDGLLYCGRCHTPKQTRMDTNPMTGEPGPVLVPIACQCVRTRADKERRRQEREQFGMKIRQLWEDGISYPEGLRDRFSGDDRRNAKLSDACGRYVEQWEAMRKDNIGILFYGSVGTGKTFFASCIGNGLLDRLVPVAVTNFPRLLNLLQGTQNRQRLLDRLSVYKLLIIDDLGVERDSPYAAEQVFNVVDARARSKLPLIVTTNLTLEELEHPASMQYARIYDRILELCPVRLKLAGGSRRVENAERRKETARKLLLES